MHQSALDDIAGAAPGYSHTQECAAVARKRILRIRQKGKCGRPEAALSELSTHAHRDSLHLAASASTTSLMYSPTLLYLLGKRIIYRTRKEVQLALVRLSSALPNMLKDADTFHDQFERRAEAIIRGSPTEFENYIYERLREMVVTRGITPRPGEPHS